MDVNDKISVISINTLYYDSMRDKSDSTGSGVQQMFWLEDQLKRSEPGRKFVIIQHVYGGARANNHPMWFTYPNNIYFDLLNKYKDKIIIEVGGHDHFSNMRYHTDRDVLDMTVPAPADADLFHNLIINPSVSPWHGNNPGISVFEIDDITLEPQNY